MPIITCGIVLPNGRFLPNGTGNQEKNARRFCEQYPQLYQLMNDQTDLNPDEFLITAGCGVIAGCNGNHSFSVAKDNCNPIIEQMVKDYQCLGYIIWPYWKIKSENQNVLNEIISNMSMMEMVVRKEALDNMNLRGKRGFIIQGKFWPNSGKGHETNARDIIHEKGWDNEWTTGSAQDFIVLEKQAVQIGSASYNEVILAACKYYSESKIEKIAKMHGLEEYKHYLI